MARVSTLLSIVLVFCLVGIAHACPACKDAIPNSDAQSSGGLPGGFNLSIYYMLGSLFCVIAGFGYFIVRTIRATDRSASPGLPTSSPVSP